MSKEIINLKNLKKYYGERPNIVKANDNINLVVNESDFLIILGNSGSGKSTLLNIIGGLLTPTDGEVVIDGEDIGKFNDKALTKFRRQKIGFVFQDFNLIPFLSVYENIVLPLEFDKSKLDTELFDNIIITLGLKDKLNAYPSQLSGGQKQRVAIARALIGLPKILLCDEPTGNLDSKITIEILNLLKEIATEFGTTVIMITHNESLLGYANRYVRISDGRIVEDNEVI